MQPGALPELGGLECTQVDLASLLAGGTKLATLALRQGLAEAAKPRLTPNGQARLLVIVDQLEEIFTISGLSDEERARFIAALDGLARSGLAWVIATMRSDFFDRLGDIPKLASLADGEARYLLLPPTDAELDQMIRGPAREAGLRFEVDAHNGTSLDERIREAASKREALPLLSFVLDELWKRRTDEGVLTIAAYEELGGLEGALAQRAEDAFGNQPSDVQAALPGVLRALAFVDSNGHLVSKAAPLSHFPSGSPERELIEAFSAREARLFVSGGDDASEPKVRVAHEALLTHWKRASEYLDASRADLQLEARLTEEAARYHRTGDDDRTALLLPRGLRLEEAVDLARRHGPELPGQLVAYITESTAAAKAAARRQWTVVTIIILVLALLTTVSTISFFAAQRERFAAQHERNDALIAQSRFLARDAAGAVDQGDAVTGILLALEALPKEIAHPDRPFASEAEFALENAVANQQEQIDLRGHKDAVNSAAFSSDGQRIVSASDDGTIRVWNAVSGAQTAVLHPPDHHGHDAVTSAAFSPNGQRIVSASADGTVRLWNASSGVQISVLYSRSRERWWYSPQVAPTFSPDGRRIAVISDDVTVNVLDASSGARLVVLHVPDSSGGNGPFPRGLHSTAFSPDGRSIVISDSDHAIVFDSSTGQQIAKACGSGGGVTSAAFSSDGQRIVCASNDKTVRVWDQGDDPDNSQVIRGHEGAVNSAVFSPDGRLIVSASNDNTLRVWSARSGAQITVLRGHEGAVNSVSFSPDGRRIVSASADRTIRIWSATIRAQITVLRPPGGSTYGDPPARSASFSPDGRRIVSVDTTIRVWNASTGAQIAALPESGYSASFSADGRRIVSVNGVIRVWSASTGAQIAVLKPPFSWNDGASNMEASSVSFSPNGRRIVSGYFGGTIRTWDAGSDAQVAFLRAPGEQTDLVSQAVSARGADATSVSFSPDGRRIVSVYEGTIGVFDASSGSQIGVLRSSDHDNHDAASAAFSPDGRHIVSASADKTVRVWDAVSGAQTAILRGHGGEVYSAAFSLDGRRIVSASADKTVRVWDAASGEQIAILRGHSDDGQVPEADLGRASAVSSAAFSPDGRRIVSSSYDGTLRIWDLSLRGQALINAARAWLPRQLTAVQRHQEFLDRTPL